MMSDLRSWLRLGAALLAIAPISASFGYAEADLEKLKRTGSCVAPICKRPTSRQRI